MAGSRWSSDVTQVCVIRLFVPKIYRQRGFQLFQEMTHNNLSILLKKWLSMAKIGMMVGAQLGYFTLNCFRRGAVQHWLMITLRGKWATTVIKRWSGWSSSEKLETIMKCILDEMHEEEMCFCDMHLSYHNAQKWVSSDSQDDPLTNDVFLTTIVNLKRSLT